MSNRKRPYSGNARFLELGQVGAPFRSLINVDHISNVRFEQAIGQTDPVYDQETGEMTEPPQQFLEGWKVIIVIAHGAGGQNIMFPNEEQAVETYNTILDMMTGVGAPIARMPRLKAEPPPPEQSAIVGADGQPVANDDIDQDMVLPGEDGHELTDEELAQLEDPEIDVDALADAVEDGLGADDDKG